MTRQRYSGDADLQACHGEQIKAMVEQIRGD
jgi:hypothetical protein